MTDDLFSSNWNSNLILSRSNSDSICDIGFSAMHSNYSEKNNLFNKKTNQDSKEKNTQQENDTQQVSNNRDSNKKEVKTKKSKNFSKRSENIKKRVQGYYFTFLVIFINFIIKNLLGNKYEPEKMKFSQFTSEFKKNIYKKNIETFRKKSIEEMLTKDDNNISYPKNKINNNSDVYKTITNINSNIKYLLSENLYKFFPLFYYKGSKKEIDLCIYNINQKIDLSNIKNFYDDYKTKLNDEYPNEKEFLYKIEKVIKRDFLKSNRKKKFFDIIKFY